MKHLIRLIGPLCALLLLGCGGGGFTPEAGVFAGELFVGEESVGSFNFTVNNGELAGTGTIVHNEQPVNVAIAALLNDTTITGTIANASLGSGAFTGTFNSETTCAGTFSYADIGGISQTVGTWSADNAQ